MRGREHLMNLPLLADALEQQGIRCRLRSGDAGNGLQGMKFYEPGGAGQEGFLLICADPQAALPVRGNLLLLGDWSAAEISPNAGCLFLPEPPEPVKLYNLLSDLFVRYQTLEESLWQCLQVDSSLKRICDLWLETFGTDIFIHDHLFRILACPRHIAQIPPFEYNEQIGCYMQDSATLTNFLTSSAYQQTMTTRGGNVWESDFNDNCSLYANIWFESVYQGRMVVLDSQPTPGKLRLVEYFGAVAAEALQNRSLSRSDGPDPLRSVVLEAILGEPIDEGELQEKIRWLGWELRHRYVCAVVTFGGEDISRYIIMGICNAFQKLLKGCYTCCYQDSIFLLVNLTVSRMTMGEFRARAADLVREAILHMGVSQEFYDLTHLADYMAQARLEERYTRELRLTSWYNEFQDHALQYWLTRGTGEMASECLVSNVLTCLKAYDRENGTDLYQTLKVYLISERNATLTGQSLKIHRSTLPHRLNRIRELTGVNLDMFSTRLYLLMSFALEELEHKTEK